MTMSLKPHTNNFPQALLMLNTALVIANWYVRPQHASVWIVSLVLVGCMTLALLVQSRKERDTAEPQIGNSVRNGILWAGAILLIALGSKLGTAVAARLGIASATDISWRATMVVISIFLILAGNAIPKALTPLSQLRCNAAKLQSFQRFGGWTWVLTGFVLLNAWLVLPGSLADFVTFVSLPAAMILIGFHWLRLRRAPPTTI